jgi:hypothetical protein
MNLFLYDGLSFFQKIGKSFENGKVFTTTTGSLQKGMWLQLTDIHRLIFLNFPFFLLTSFFFSFLKYMLTHRWSTPNISSLENGFERLT